MKGHVIAESHDIVECDGHAYFPRSAVRMGSLEKAPRTDEDLECPHGVQFYAVVVGGTRHGRAARSYEAPGAEMKHVAGRFGFREDVEVACMNPWLESRLGGVTGPDRPRASGSESGSRRPGAPEDRP